MKTFKEQDFDMTFIYPADFVPANPGAAAPVSYSLPATRPANPPCVQAPLSVGTNAAGTSALVISIIDDACPSILRDAHKLGPFVHAQLLRQLQRYGAPAITLDTRLYTFDDRPAAVILGRATPAPQSVEPQPAKPQPATPPAITYAAKVCMYAKVPASSFGRLHRELTAANSIICFDFTSHQSDLLQPLLFLPVVFGDSTPRSLVPAAILR